MKQFPMYRDKRFSSENIKFVKDENKMFGN